MDYTFDSVREKWYRLPQATPFQSFEWNYLYWSHLGAGKLLRLYSTEDTILPLWGREVEDQLCLEFIGSRGTDYLDAIGSQGGLQEILSLVAEDTSWDVIRFDDTPEGGQIDTCATEIFRKFVFVRRESVDCYRVPMPPVLSRRTEQDMIYSEKRLQRTCANIRFLFADDFRNVEKHLELHIRRQRPKNTYLYFPDEARAFILSFLTEMNRLDKVVLSALYAGDDLISTVISVSWNNILYALYTGFDTKFAKFRPGMILWYSILNRMRHLDAIDLSRGSEMYKNKLGGLKKKNLRIEIARKPKSLKDFRAHLKLLFADCGYEPSVR